MTISRIAALAAIATLAFASVGSAKEGSSGNGKNRVAPPPPASTACVESPVAAAWGGLTLSPWNATNLDTGETWTFQFDDKGGVVFSRNGGPQVIGTYAQPLDNVRDAGGVTILTSPGARLGATVPFVVPHTNCTMTWYTNTGPLLMVRT
jgi:hypothetical protein